MMNRTLFFSIFLFACSSSPNVASTSAAGAGGAGDAMSGLFGGHGGSGSITLVDGRGGGAGGSSGTGAGAGGSSAQDAGADVQDGEVASPDGGVDAGPVVDPECEGIEFPESDCQCAGFDMRAYVFCPGPLDKAGAVASCSGVSGLEMIGYDVYSGMTTRTTEKKWELARFVGEFGGGIAVWSFGYGADAISGCLMYPGVWVEGDSITKDVPCSELHAYVCEEKL